MPILVTPGSPKPDFVVEEVGRALDKIPKSSRLLVGVSGGRDSVVLLTALLESGRRNLIVCHLDHRLRGRASSADAAFVRRLAHANQLRMFEARGRTALYAEETGKSLELAARELRQAFFAACASRARCRRLVLAHHADDQVETCLFHFLRGAGAAGLAGMRRVSHLGGLEVFRPMLDVESSAIEAFAKERRLKFRTDASNASPAHTRNRVRHGILPAIEAHWGGGFRSAIRRAADIARDEDDWMNSLLPAADDVLDVKFLRSLHPAAQSRLVLQWLRACGVSEAGYAETRRVLELLNPGGIPAKVNLPGALHARRQSGRIFLECP